MHTSARTLRVFKYQALGNSYLIVDPRRIGPALDAFESSDRGEPRPASPLVRMLCSRSTGVGSNGLLFGPLPSSAERRFGLRIVNSDGTSAAFSGNGTRIFARYLIDYGDAHPGEIIEMVIPDESGGRGTGHNVVRARLSPRFDGPIEITVPQAPLFGAAAVAAKAGLFLQAATGPGTQALRYAFPAMTELGAKIIGSADAWMSCVLVDIGNPHCVTLVSREDQMPPPAALRAHDGALRAIAFDGQSAAFANGANLQWAWPQTRTRLRLAIYERGEGPTPASGSSACAAACAAFASGLVDDNIEVAMPGGALAVRLTGDPANITGVALSGSASRVLDGNVDLPSLADEGTLSDADFQLS